MIYNSLFNHIEDNQHHLENKQRPWKRQLYQGLSAAHRKLSNYYGKTYEFQGVIYAIGTVLDPCQKLSVFHGASWEENGGSGVSWSVKYEDVLRKVFSYYRNRYPVVNETTASSTNLNAIDRALHQYKRRRYNQQFDSDKQSQNHQYIELQRYLDDER